MKFSVTSSVPDVTVMSGEYGIQVCTSVNKMWLSIFSPFSIKPNKIALSPLIGLQSPLANSDAN